MIDREDLHRREVGAVLDLAAAHGWLAARPLAVVRDRLGRLLYGLQRG